MATKKDKSKSSRTTTTAGKGLTKRRRSSRPKRKAPGIGKKKP